MKWNDVEVLPGDILLIGKKITPFYVLKDLLYLPFDLIRFKTPRLFADLVSDRIQRNTKSIWNHVEILHPINGDINTLCCIGAQPKGVRLSTVDFEFPEKKFRLKILRPKKQFPIEDRIKVVTEAYKAIGKPYGFMTILKVRWALLTGGLEKLHKMVGSDDSVVICSTFVDKLWYDAAKEDILTLINDYPSPASFNESSALETIWVRL